MKIALSLLCENPRRKTGLTTTYHEFVARSLKLFPDLSWVVFVGPDQEWQVQDARVELVRNFPANDRIVRRLFADHFRVPSLAHERGAQVMISTGFVPIRKSLPTVMHVFSLQHLDTTNRIGLAREWYRRFITHYSWPKADLVITNSKFAVSQILSVFPEFGSRIVQAYEGLQHEQFHPTRAQGETERLRGEAGLEPGYFLWLSNFYPYKQPGLLIAAYAGLDPETRRRHPLVMVGGEWGNCQAGCREQVRALGVENDVKFLGWVGEDMLAPLYRHALAHVMPSREETFGRTVIESMACGTPCVLNDIPIMREVTEGHALIVDFKDARQVADALDRMAKDDTVRAGLRDAGIRRAGHFTFEKFTTERIVAIQRLLSGHK
jgi:glycosyltransferase involved in cell wall biosynthesis